MSPHPALPAGPVVVVHLEDPPGSSLAACCGLPFGVTEGYPEVPRVFCSGCYRAVQSPARPARPKVVIRTVGWQGDGLPDSTWPEGWPPPAADQVVWLREGDRMVPQWVRDVAWYPTGEGEGTEPYVYVVVGRRRTG